MTTWMLMLYTAALGAVPLGTYKTEGACYEAVVSIKFDYIEKNGLDNVPNLSCVRVKRQAQS